MDFTFWYRKCILMLRPKLVEKLLLLYPADVNPGHDLASPSLDRVGQCMGRWDDNKARKGWRDWKGRRGERIASPWFQATISNNLITSISDVVISDIETICLMLQLKLAIFDTKWQICTLKLLFVVTLFPIPNRVTIGDTHFTVVTTFWYTTGSTSKLEFGHGLGRYYENPYTIYTLGKGDIVWRHFLCFVFLPFWSSSLL